MVSHGATLNAATRAAGSTALHRAASNGKIDICRFFIGKGADLKIRDHDQSTALHKVRV